MIELTDSEQRILDRAASEVLLANEHLRQHAERTELLKQGLMDTTSKLRHALATIVELRGEDPTDYSGSWDAKNDHFILVRDRKKENST